MTTGAPTAPPPPADELEFPPECLGAATVTRTTTFCFCFCFCFGTLF